MSDDAAPAQPALAWWTIVPLAIGATWSAAALSLAFSTGQYLRLYQLLTSLPLGVALAMAMAPRFGPKQPASRITVMQAAFAAHLMLLALGLGLYFAGRVPLTEGAWWRRVGAAIGAIACVIEIARLQRVRRGPLESVVTPAEERLAAAQRATALMDEDPAAAGAIFRELVLKDPGETFYRLGLATALQGQGLYAESVAVLLAGGTQSSGFEVQLAAAYVGLNDWAQARTHAAAAVRLATTPEETKIAQGVLDSLGDDDAGGALTDAVVVLMRASVPTSEWFERLSEAVKDLGTAKRVSDTVATLQLGPVVLAVTAERHAFSEVTERVNWALWLEGRSQEGLTFRLALQQPGAAAVNAVVAVAAKLLEQSGAGIIVPSTRRALKAGDWLNRLGSDRKLPLAGFIDIGPVDNHPTVLIADGFSPWGLPDLGLEAGTLPEAERWDRGTHALTFIAQQLIERGKPLQAGEHFDVPFGVELGGRDADAQNPGLNEAPTEQWEARATPNGPMLHCPVPFVPRAEVLLAPGGYLAYRALFKVSVLGAGKGSHAGSLPAAEEAGVPYEVFAQAFEGGFLTTTVGLGRHRQPRSGPKGTGFIELALRTPWHSVALAQRLERLAQHYLARGTLDDAPPWGDWHRISVEGLDVAAPELKWMVLFPWRTHVLAGHTVVHWNPVLMTTPERDSVPTHQLSQWLTPGKANDLGKRWLSGLPQLA